MENAQENKNTEELERVNQEQNSKRKAPSSLEEAKQILGRMEEQNRTIRKCRKMV